MYRSCRGWCCWYQNAEILFVWWHGQHCQSNGVVRWRYCCLLSNTDHAAVFCSYTHVMHFGLRDRLQNGIKWEKLVDIPIQNDAANAFANICFSATPQKFLSKCVFDAVFIRISTTFSLTETGNVRTKSPTVAAYNTLNSAVDQF